MRKFNFLPLAFLLLVGCASLGLVTPETFNEKAAFTREAVNGVIGATTTALDAQAIHSSDAEWVRNTAQRTLVLLVSAETAYGAGDPATAEGRLKLAQGVLKELQKYLATKGVKS